MREPFSRLARPFARLWWIGDPMQKLCGRPPVPLPYWTLMHADTNHRSQGLIPSHVSRRLLLDRSIAAGNALAGSEVEIFTYADTTGLVAQNRHAL